jgi:hypothetical protein
MLQEDKLSDCQDKAAWGISGKRRYTQSRHKSGFAARSDVIETAVGELN